MFSTTFQLFSLALVFFSFARELGLAGCNPRNRLARADDVRRRARWIRGKYDVPYDRCFSASAAGFEVQAAFDCDVKGGKAECPVTDSNSQVGTFTFSSLQPWLSRVQRASPIRRLDCLHRVGDFPQDSHCVQTPLHRRSVQVPPQTSTDRCVGGWIGSVELCMALGRSVYMAVVKEMQFGSISRSFGIPFWVFLVAAVVSLSKQLMLVRQGGPGRLFEYKHGPFTNLPRGFGS
ncbi:hypothetical protein DFH08DRAFT_1050639 [Mycena albidolilacea]|uniref:Uncharacterized protein n=1 Tax=Mycena albidolilacea TaxID=1033008 RepID=A0AAD6Z650_9AGAR|nr:hypothetical protein DFH08DRAFT_1050639 [Mycena albidolilacea]